MAIKKVGHAPKRLVILGFVGIAMFGVLGARLWFLQAVGSRDVEYLRAGLVTRKGIFKAV